MIYRVNISPKLKLLKYYIYGSIYAACRLQIQKDQREQIKIDTDYYFCSWIYVLLQNPISTVNKPIPTEYSLLSDGLIIFDVFDSKSQISVSIFVPILNISESAWILKIILRLYFAGKLYYQCFTNFASYDRPPITIVLPVRVIAPWWLRACFKLPAIVQMSFLYFAIVEVLSVERSRASVRPIWPPMM